MGAGVGRGRVGGGGPTRRIISWIRLCSSSRLWRSASFWWRRLSADLDASL